MFKNKVIINLTADGAIDSVIDERGRKLSTQSTKLLASKLNDHYPSASYYVYIGEANICDGVFRIGISKNPYTVAEGLGLRLIRLVRFETRTAAKAFEFKIRHTIRHAGFRVNSQDALAQLPNAIEWIDSQGDPRVVRYLKYVPVPDSALFAGGQEEAIRTV